jgi:hypothetical protein
MFIHLDDQRLGGKKKEKGEKCVLEQFSSPRARF